MVLALPSWWPRGLWLQWITASVVTSMLFVTGLSAGWSSPYSAKFLSGDSPFPATVGQINWIVSFNQLGGIPGAILGAIGAQYFGNKTAMLASGCCMLISWILVIVANSVSWIYAARFICGASIEAMNISFPLYLGDITSSKIRGASVALASNGVVVGILTGNVMGSSLSMKLFACLALVPNIFFLLTFYWIPDSAYFLVSRNKMKNAERSVRMYNPKADVPAEMESIKKFLHTTNSVTLMDRLREFNIPYNRKAGLIICMLIVFGHSSGVVALESYMESVVVRGRVTVIAPSTVPIIANCFGLIAGWTLMYFAEKFGRKAMWMISSSGICGTLIALGTHFYLIDLGFDSEKLQWIPIFSMILLKVFYNLGVSCVVAIILSEIFASNIRTLAAWVCSVISAILGFVSILTYQFLLERIDEAYIYWIYAIFMLMSAIFGSIFIPQTQGKTLLEIQNDLQMN